MNPYEIGARAALEKYATHQKEAFLPALGALAPWVSSALFGGALGAGANALMAPQGQKMESALKGFGYGALGGLGARGLGTGIGALLKTGPAQSWLTSQPSGVLGRMSRWGAKQFGKAEGWAPQLAVGSMLPNGMPKMQQPTPRPAPYTNLPQYY